MENGIGKGPGPESQRRSRIEFATAALQRAFSDKADAEARVMRLTFDLETANERSIAATHAQDKARMELAIALSWDPLSDAAQIEADKAIEDAASAARTAPHATTEQPGTISTAAGRPFESVTFSLLADGDTVTATAHDIGAASGNREHIATLEKEPIDDPDRDRSVD
jgi:hypothetical protein